MVFSVGGIGNRGRSAASATEAVIVRTAEEAYCARFGTYATAAQLVMPAGLLAAEPRQTGVVVVPGPDGGTCGGTGYVLGSTGTQQTAGGTPFAAASNTTPPFTFLQPDFQAANGGQAATFTFGSSATLAATVNQSSNPIVLFASADEANLNKVIATTDPVAGGTTGTCSGTCLGVGSTKRQYTTGRLVVFSCAAGGATLVPASGAPTCKAPAGGYLATPPTTVTDVVNLLASNPSFKLTIADPGGPGHIPVAAPSTAPYGYAAYQALRAPVPAGGGGLSDAQYSSFIDRGQIVFASNVTSTQTNVVTGAVHMALLPRSFVMSPTGDDTNRWTAVPANLHEPIRQWATVLDKGNPGGRLLAQRFLDYIVSPRGQAVLAQFGYETLS